MDVLLSIRSAILYLLLGILISYKPSYTHACVCVCVCAHSLPYTSCLCVYVCVRVCVCKWLYTYLCVILCRYFRICVWLYVCERIFCVRVCVRLGSPRHIRARNLSLSLPRTPLSLIFSSVLSTELCQTRVVWFSKQNIVHFLDRCFHTF